MQYKWGKTVILHKIFFKTGAETMFFDMDFCLVTLN